MDDLRKKLLLDIQQEPNMSIGTPATFPIEEESEPVEETPQSVKPTTPIQEKTPTTTNSGDVSNNKDIPDSEDNSENQDEYFNELMRKSVYERPKTPEFKNAFDNERVNTLLKEYESLANVYKQPQDTTGENIHRLASTLAAASGNQALASNQSEKANALRSDRINKLDRYQDIMKTMSDLEIKKQDAQNEIEQLRFKAESTGYLTAAEMAKLKMEQEKLDRVDTRLNNQLEIARLSAFSQDKRFNEAQDLRESNAEKSKIDKINSLASEYRKDPTVQAFEKQGIAVGEINTILDQIASGNKMAISSLGIKMAKGMGEVGAMTKDDVTKYIEPKDWKGSLEATLDKIFKSKIPLKQGKDLRMLVNELQKNLKPNIDMIKKNYAQRAYESYGKDMGLSPEEVEVKMGFRNSISQSSNPNKTTISLGGKKYRIDSSKVDAFKTKYPNAIIEK